MERRKLNHIKRDLRACYENAGIGEKMNDREIVEHFIREARALERELELQKTGAVLTTA